MFRVWWDWAGVRRWKPWNWYAVQVQCTVRLYRYSYCIKVPVNVGTGKGSGTNLFTGKEVKFKVKVEIKCILQMQIETQVVHVQVQYRWWTITSRFFPKVQRNCFIETHAVVELYIFIPQLSELNWLQYNLRTSSPLLNSRFLTQTLGGFISNLLWGLLQTRINYEVPVLHSLYLFLLEHNFVTINFPLWSYKSWTKEIIKNKLNGCHTCLDQMIMKISTISWHTPRRPPRLTGNNIKIKPALKPMQLHIGFGTA